MNFAQVKSITIPEGKVTKITSNGIVLWSGAEPEPTNEIVPMRWYCYRLGKVQGVTVDANLLQPDTTDPETDVAAGYHNSATFNGTGNPCAYWAMIPEFVTKQQWTNRISHRVDSTKANEGSIWSDGTTEFTVSVLSGVPALDAAGYGVKIYNPIYNKFIGYKEIGYTDRVGITLVDFDDAIVFTVKQGLQGVSTLNFQVKNNPRLAGFTLDSYGLQNGYTEWWTNTSSNGTATTYIVTWFVGGNAAPNYMWQYSQRPTYHNGTSVLPTGTNTYISLTTSQLTSLSTPFWLSLIETAPGRGKLVYGRMTGSSTSLTVQGLIMGPNGFKKASSIDDATEMYVTDSEQYGKIFTYYPYDTAENYTLYAYTDAATGNIRGGQSRSFGQIPTNLNWVEVKDMP